jgi:DNA methylase
MQAAQLFPIEEVLDQDPIEALRNFEYAGNKTIVETRNGIPFFFNEFWTARQRQGHAIHEISYRACFKPQLPEFFISRLTRPGDTVYDPFMGRGTTPIQAVLMGRNAIGNDINPLSTFLTRPRTNPPSIEDIATRLRKIDWTADVEVNEDLLAFYHPETLRQITILRETLLAREKNGVIDSLDDWIRMVAVNRLTGHSPGFFSVYSLPPNQAVSVESQRKINEKRNQIPPIRDVVSIIMKKSRGLLKDGRPRFRTKSTFIVRSADSTPEIQTGSIDLAVTSPPFLDVVQYASDNWLRSWFVGIDPKSVSISMHKNPADWTAFVTRTFTELERIVAPGGYVAFEVGEVRGGKIQLEDLVLQAIRNLKFEPLGVVVNVQEFTKTANCWGVSNNSKGTNTNRIVLARRLWTTSNA